MLKNFIVIGIRNLFKQRGYSIIKILGLAFGLASAMVIFLYVQEDLSYDRFHKNYDRIVRVLTIDKAEGVSSKLVGVTPPPLGPALAQELPGVKRAARLQSQGRYDISYEDKTLKCEAAFLTESSFFDVFDFRIVEGERATILDKPNSIAITKSLSKKIFGDVNPIGKSIKINQSTNLFVTGLLEDPPKNSHIQFDLLRSIEAPENSPGFRQYLENWQGISTFTYLLLDQPRDEADLNTGIQAISKKHKAVEFFVPVVQPLSKVHLYSKDILFESNANKSDVLNVYVLSTIALLVLILAAVNFMNLVTAKSAGRAKEVGMRKVIGAARHQLILQHLVESVIITVIAAVIAVILVYFLVRPLNNIYQRFADFDILLKVQNLATLAGLTLVVGIFAGLYPAFVLSSFKPAVVLKGAFKNSASGVQMRKVLVVLQFTISIALMVGTGVVYEQMQFIFTKDLGYSREQVIMIQQNGPTSGRSEALKTELLRKPAVVAVGTSSTPMGQQLGRTQIYPEGTNSETNIITSTMGIDETFIPAMGMQIVAGRNFSLDFADSLSLIINEEMVRMLKWGDAVGRKISLQTGPNPQDLTAYTVVGVVKDFHFATIRHKVEPLFMQYSQNNFGLVIKIKTEETRKTLSFIADTWKKINPGTTFEYNFLDEQFANQYRNEEAFANMFSHFAALAITIAGMGLFALSAFTAAQRSKEIGIRKVLGASNQTIVYILSREFIQLILIAFGLASVLAYFVMKRWLQDFSYSITMNYGVFLAAGVLSLVIAMLTISFQAVKAAVANPVDSLRSE